MFELGMVKLVILLLMGPFIEFEQKGYFLLRDIYGKLMRLSNQFEPYIVFD